METTRPTYAVIVAAIAAINVFFTNHNNGWFNGFAGLTPEAWFKRVWDGEGELPAVSEAPFEGNEIVWIGHDGTICYYDTMCDCYASAVPELFTALMESGELHIWPLSEYESEDCEDYDPNCELPGEQLVLDDDLADA